MSETQKTTNRIETILTKLGHTDDAVDIMVQSQTEPLFKYYIMDDKQTGITLTSVAEKNATSMNVSASHGFTATGEYLVIRYGDLFEQLKVTGVSTNTISVEMPLARDYPISGTIITRGIIGMNIDGDTTPTTYHFQLLASSGATVPIDISTVIITMQHGANVPDDGKFGGLDPTGFNGLYFRKENGETHNLGNYITNRDFRTIGADIEYSQKAPAGTYGTNITIDITKIFGKVLRIDPATDDDLLAHIRDNISTTEGMSSMNIAILGSYTSGEN